MIRALLLSLGLLMSSSYSAAEPALAICGPKTWAHVPTLGEVLRVDVFPFQVNLLTQVSEVNALWSKFPHNGLAVSDLEIVGEEAQGRFLHLQRTPETSFSGFVILSGVKIDVSCR
jgi:hypothetical protein